MGISGMSVTEILIILVIVVLLFGTSRLSRIGSDLGSAIRGFRAAMKDDPSETPPKTPAPDSERPVER